MLLILLLWSLQTISVADIRTYRWHGRRFPATAKVPVRDTVLVWPCVCVLVRAKTTAPKLTELAIGMWYGEPRSDTWLDLSPWPFVFYSIRKLSIRFRCLLPALSIINVDGVILLLLIALLSCFFHHVSSGLFLFPCGTSVQPGVCVCVWVGEQVRSKCDRRQLGDTSLGRRRRSQGLRHTPHRRRRRRRHRWVAMRGSTHSVSPSLSVFLPHPSFLLPHCLYLFRSLTYQGSNYSGGVSGVLKRPWNKTLKIIT